MASEKANACTSSNQTKSSDEKPNTKATTCSNLEKALAQRALSGSHNHRVGRRKFANSGAKLQPSRLSKVSLAEDSVD
uniref:Uncharacterized protein n=1 Tax=Fagus sylvatica TaxID=28930 RepID=A0A2N9EMT5_FAGSY